MKKIFNIIENIILVILIILVIFIGIIFIQTIISSDKIPSLFGYKPFIVLSSSMEKEMYRGDLIITKTIDPIKLKKNDIIAFKDKKSKYVVTHRIVGIKKEYNTLMFVTKGDNNNVADSDLVKPKDIEGIFVKRYPGLGNVILTLQESSTLIISLLVIITCGLLIIIVDNNKLSSDERKVLEEYRAKNNININK